MSIGVISQNMCALCSSAEENRDHLFFDCPYSTYIWNLCRLKLGLCAEGNDTLIKRVSELQSRFKSKNRTTAVAWLVFRSAIWHIWKERDSRIFRRITSHKVAVFRRLYADVHLLLQFCNWPGDPHDPILCNWSWCFYLCFSFGSWVSEIVYECISFGSTFAPYFVYYSRGWWLWSSPLFPLKFNPTTSECKSIPLKLIYIISSK